MYHCIKFKGRSLVVSWNLLWVSNPTYQLWAFVETTEAGLDIYIYIERERERLAKCATKINGHYYTIINGCMNTRRGKSVNLNFLILLYSLFGSNITIVNMTQKLKLKIYASTQCKTEAVKSTTNKSFKVDFWLPQFSVTKFVIWEFHVDDSIKVGYYMILSRNLLTDLVLDLNSPNTSSKEETDHMKHSGHPR